MTHPADLLIRAVAYRLTDSPSVDPWAALYDLLPTEDDLIDILAERHGIRKCGICDGWGQHDGECADCAADDEWTWMDERQADAAHSGRSDDDAR